MKYKFKLEMNDGSCLPFQDFNVNLTFKCLELESMKFRLFTGRLDKNGREIYEGDRVRIADKEYIVKYHVSYMSFVFDFIEGPWFVSDFEDYELDEMEIV